MRMAQMPYSETLVSGKKDGQYPCGKDVLLNSIGYI